MSCLSDSSRTRSFRYSSKVRHMSQVRLKMARKKRDLRSEIHPKKSRTCGHENESCRPIEAKKEKLIGCGKCSYSCSTMTQLKYHFLVHQKASLRCPLCPDFVAHQMQSLKRHQRQVHGSIEVLKCKGT